MSEGEFTTPKKLSFSMYKISVMFYVLRQLVKAVLFLVFQINIFVFFATFCFHDSVNLMKTPQYCAKPYELFIPAWFESVPKE